MGVGSNQCIWLFKSSSASPADGTSSPFLDLIGSRTASNSSKLYVDGVNTSTSTTADSGALNSIKPCFGALGTTNTKANSFENGCEQVAGWGSSLSATDVANLRSRVQTLKTALGR